MIAIHALALFGAVAAVAAASNPVSVSSLEDLAAAASRNNQVVTMTPGVYRVIDYIPLSAVAERRKARQWHWLAFSGSNNVFHLGGVVIEFDTALRQALRPPVHTDDFVISGESNVINGLKITNLGDGLSPGGAALAVRGNGNTLRGCTLRVRGSYPYGYGDLFGKGGNDVIRHQKMSGLLVTGHGTTLAGCTLYMRSFGHGFYVQQDASNVLFENCRVEGVMRSTDEMLAETSGPAFKAGFRTVAKNRDGQNKVTPGYMKSLSEDGFRTYGAHTNIVFRNCTAKNMRGGFELRTKAGAVLENCEVIECERGYWVSSSARVIDSRGDARYGPLLFVEGENAVVEVQLSASESAMNVHALATVHGRGHKVTISPAGSGRRSKAVPIMLGYGTPMMGEGMAPIPEQNAVDITVKNTTAMPVIIGAKARECQVETVGPVEKNLGKDVQVGAYR